MLSSPCRARPNAPSPAPASGPLTGRTTAAKSSPPTYPSPKPCPCWRSEPSATLGVRHAVKSFSQKTNRIGILTVLLRIKLRHNDLTHVFSPESIRFVSQKRMFFTPLPPRNAAAAATALCRRAAHEPLAASPPTRPPKPWRRRKRPREGGSSQLTIPPSYHYRNTISRGNGSAAYLPCFDPAGKLA